MECLTCNEHLSVHLIICSFIKRGCAYFDTPSFTDLLTFLEPNRSLPHTTGSSDRRQECRERSYYHLHRQLHNPLLLHSLPPFFSVTLPVLVWYLLLPQS